MNVIFFGPPGVGKGTQAARITQRTGWAHISTGDMLRQQVKDGTALGTRVNDYMQKGLLVPDELVIEMFMERLAGLRRDQGFVLDGFPRTIVQACALDDALARRGKSIDIAVNIHASDAVLMQRMMGRASESARLDDTPEAMRVRLEKQKPPPDLLDHYRAAGKLRDIDGQPDMETVTSAIIEALGVANATT